MGTREIRYCDISGAEGDVESHVVQLDQMRIDIDLTPAEYDKLVRLLQRYIDAGRVEASVPDRPVTPARARRRGGPVLSLDERLELRNWAIGQGIEVPSNNRFKASLVQRWRQETGASAG
jgi:hypothetical protein